MKVRTLGKDGPKVTELNRRKAIRECCLNCSGWEPSEVRDCAFTDCHLYPYRMGTGKQNAKARNKAIRKYCLWCCCGQRKEVQLCPSKSCPLHVYRLGAVDRSSEWPESSKKAHIEPDFETETNSKTDWTFEPQSGLYMNQK